MGEFFLHSAARIVRYNADIHTRDDIANMLPQSHPLRKFWVELPDRLMDDAEREGGSPKATDFSGMHNLSGFAAICSGTVHPEVRSELARLTTEWEELRGMDTLTAADRRHDHSREFAGFCSTAFSWMGRRVFRAASWQWAEHLTAHSETPALYPIISSIVRNPNVLLTRMTTHNPLLAKRGAYRWILCAVHPAARRVFADLKRNTGPFRQIVQTIERHESEGFVQDMLNELHADEAEEDEQETPEQEEPHEREEPHDTFYDAWAAPRMPARITPPMRRSPPRAFGLVPSEGPLEVMRHAARAVARAVEEVRETHDSAEIRNSADGPTEVISRGARAVEVPMPETYAEFLAERNRRLDAARRELLRRGDSAEPEREIMRTLGTPLVQPSGLLAGWNYAPPHEDQTPSPAPTPQPLPPPDTAQYFYGYGDEERDNRPF